jgi:hypothetical protein
VAANNDEIRELLALDRTRRPGGAAGRPGDRQVLRVTRERFTPDVGPARDYVALRIWQDDGKGVMRPTKRGVTLRRSEMAEIVATLQAAFTPGPPPRAA